MNRIVINTIPLRGTLTGVARYVQEVASRLPGNVPDSSVEFFNGIFSSRPRTDIPFASKTRISLRTFHKRCIRSSLYLSLRALHMGMSLSRSFDLYFEPNHIPLATIRSKRLVTTVHDLSVALFPQWHPEKRRRYFHRHFDSRTPRSDVIVTVSEHVKHEVMEYFSLPSERVRAIHNGLDHATFRPRSANECETVRKRYGIDGPFLLFTGSIEPRKNILGALKAYSMLPEAIKREHRFVLCGFEGWHNTEIMELIEQEKNRIKYLGYITDDELAALYSEATAFVFPSFYEGFGLPPLEAMACGAAVIVSDRASLPEVCGEAARYVSPDDPESIAHAMQEIIEDTALRNSLNQQALVQAAKFQWDESAQAHAKLFSEVI